MTRDEMIDQVGDYYGDVDHPLTEPAETVGAPIPTPDGCPWCPATPHVYEFVWGDRVVGHHSKFGVECQNDDCPVMPCTGDYDTRDGALSAWNTRAPVVADGRTT